MILKILVLCLFSLVCWALDINNNVARTVTGSSEMDMPSMLGYGVSLKVNNMAGASVGVEIDNNMTDDKKEQSASKHSKMHTTAIVDDDAEGDDFDIKDPDDLGFPDDVPDPFLPCVLKAPDRVLVTNVNVNNIAADHLKGETVCPPCERKVCQRGCEIEKFSTIADILDKGQLHCGVSARSEVLGAVGLDGRRAGFDVDLCKAVAAAMFSDFNSNELRRLKYTSSTPATRFQLLENGAHMVAAATTKTMERTLTYGFQFGPIMLYDGAAILARKSSGFSDAEDFRDKGENAVLCAVRQTTSPDVIRAQFPAAAIVLSNDFDQMLNDWEEGRCEAGIFDMTQFLGRFDFIEKLGGVIIQDVSLSKEPLAPFVSEQDPEFARLVEVVLNGLMLAADDGVDSQDAGLNPAFTVYRNENALADMLNIPRGFMRRVIQTVGNYDELYKRHFERFLDADVIRKRGLNTRHSRGGLMYGFQ